MKKYLAFAGDLNYPVGGWRDFRGSFDTVSEAEAACFSGFDSCEWWHVVDRDTQEVCRQGRR